MATFMLEDLRASIEVFVFPKVMAQVGPLLADDAIVVLRGRVDTRDEQVKLVCMEVTRPELAVDGAAELHIRVPVGIFSGDTVDRLKQVLRDNPGEEPVFLHVGETVLRLSGEFSVNSRRGLAAELRVLLGPNAIC
jgi:DNA polymerase-3 subunit alpha